MPIKFYKYKKQVPLAAGQTLHFQNGRYYAAAPSNPQPPGYMYSGSPESMALRAPGFRVISPRATTPGPKAKPPVDPYAALSTKAIDQRATALANAGLDPQLAETRRQQGLAERQAQADEAAITGFQTAAGQLMQGIGPAVGDAYQRAAATEGAIGTGVGGQVGQDLAAKAAANEAFDASQGQSGGTTVDATGTGAAVSMLGGVIPGDSLAEEGAARQAEAASNVAIPLNAGREELAARMAQAKQQNDDYAQQLIQLAAQFPGLKAQALQQLNQYELDKANYRKGLRDAAESKRVDTANIAAQRADTKRQNRALIAQEKAAGISAANTADEINARHDLAAYRWASLDFQSKKEADKAKKAAREGKIIDTQASKLLGHIVYKDGTQDKSIKVKQTAGTKTDPHIKAQANRAKATQVARQDAYKYATTLRGKPQVNKTAGTLTGGKGKYIADPSEKYGVPGGVFPPAYKGAPATTNDPNRAARTGGGATDYADAQTKVWAQIGGDSLMSRFGYSREQVMAIVNRALAAAGWRR